MSRLIIPCAGFGTRMSMEKNKSKELLLYQGGPLIEFSLDLAKDFDLNPLVITRAEKIDLIDYCEKNEIETQIIEVNGEWADTVLQSAPHWEEDNILILPDTIFNPSYSPINDILHSLEIGSNAIFALHHVEDSSKWGIIKDYTLFEKPDFNGPGLAWGLIGFKKEYGLELFSNCQKGKSFKLENCGFTYLDEFKDLTRTGKIG